ncbi:MAG: hypothetical protein MRY83_14850 [Flavobacteriales bacterium]|nr:hypothetical protein [Flavobacteriales bacterium]
MTRTMILDVLKRKSALAVRPITPTGFASTPHLKPTSRGTASWMLSWKKGFIHSGWSRSPASFSSLRPGNQNDTDLWGASVLYFFLGVDRH